MFRSCVIIFLLTAVLPLSIATAQVEDSTAGLKAVRLSADRFIGTTQNGEAVRKLNGNVRLLQDKTTLRSALATQWVESDRILFDGAVTIVDQGDTLTSDEVLYYRRTKIGHAKGNVVLKDAEVRVTSISAVYDVDAKHSRFDEGVTLVDSISTLTGGRGEYFSDDKRAHFTDNVVFKDSTTTIGADSLVYFRDEKIAQASGNVLINIVEDSSDSTSLADIIWIGGPVATSNRNTNTNSVTGRATALRLAADSTGAYTDSLLVNANSLSARRTDSLDVLTGGGNVMIWSLDVAARSDSMTIRSRPGRLDVIVLTGTPVVWIDDSQLVGDTIQVFVLDGEIDSVYAVGTVFLARPDSVSGEIQQVNGQTLSGSFVDDNSSVFTIGPNAEAIHFVSEGDQLQGAVRASADRIVFYVEDEDPVRISIISGVEGTYYQADDIPPGLSLTGFLWQPTRRPTDGQLKEEWPAYMFERLSVKP